jgi:hypothetical protein
MKGRNRIRVVCLAASVAVGVVMFTGCGAKGDEPASTSTTGPSLSPTSKGSLPGGNGFSPGPVTPMNPTVNPSNQPTKNP